MKTIGFEQPLKTEQVIAIYILLFIDLCKVWIFTTLFPSSSIFKKSDGRA